jgi:hypothetical protein
VNSNGSGVHGTRRERVNRLRIRLTRLLSHYEVVDELTNTGAAYLRAVFSNRISHFAKRSEL